MKLSLGFSPCPNDTFIFDALIHHKIDTAGLEFEVFYDDVETLNLKAQTSELDITKLSFHALAYVSNDYMLLDSGSALGFGVGPLLICNKPEILGKPVETLSEIIPKLRIGIPGKYTTANFLMSFAFPEAQKKEEMKFFEIENALLNDKIDLGVIIHENRFTYQDKGLLKVIDLGEYWEKATASAIPLGGIMMKRSIPLQVRQTVNRLIRESVMHAIRNPGSTLEFIREHAQEMDPEVMYKHIELYVNPFTVNLGTEGRQAIKTFFDEGERLGIIPALEKELFL